LFKGYQAGWRISLTNDNPLKKTSRF